MAELLERRAREVEDAAVELLPVSRQVAAGDVALAQTRIAAFPGLRPLVADREPIGTVALSLPGNAILSNPVATVLSAVLAGNEVRVRLPRRRQDWAELLRDLLSEAAIPAVEIVNSDGPSFLADSFEDPDVALLMAFGADSWAAGYEDEARGTGTTFIFEGPGNDPFLVLDTEVVERAARDAVESAFYNAGQACTSPERFYVVRDAHDAFLARVVELTAQLALGDPGDQRTDVGPMESPERAAEVRDHIADATARGAEVVCGETGSEPANGGGPTAFVAPTVLTGVDPGSRLVREETSGPVLPVAAVSSAREAVELAEDSIYGLAASVYGGPDSVAPRLARSHGTVFVNETWLGRGRRQPLAPYGGRKCSGWVWEWRGHETFVRRDGPRTNLLEFSAPGGPSGFPAPEPDPTK